MQPREPIAIVGIGCRFPGGVHDPESYWSLLAEGRDAITKIPAERWLAEEYFDATGSAPGKCAARWGGFLGAVDGFDAGFFHVGANEAAHMDPQHRLLLEVAWEALERAGIPAGRLAGSPTAVYVGMYTDDYRLLHLPRKHLIDAYSGTGTVHTMAANRISYCLDLKGPSMAVDATCASSLVAVHLACESLAREECGMALAGAVNLMLSPLSMLAAAKVVGMAADGRCKTFDARADGIVRGEGCGMLVLKRLSDALADHDPVWAVIEGTAVNQDGRSNGMTAPNPAAQEDVIRLALKRGGLGPGDIQYVEAHGTGTALGDPIEMEALSRVFPSGLRVGSVKTNLGHLEAAAGMAGLIKTVLAVKHGCIPAHLHLHRISSAVAEFAGGFEIPTSLTPWPEDEKRRRAGVSAFSLGGTNAHVLLAAAPASGETTPQAESRIPHLIPLSAESPAALSQRAAEYAEWLRHADTGIELGDAGYTAAVRRSHHRCRLAVVASSLPDAAAKLSERAAASMPVARDSAGVAFVFTGQGARWSRTGRELLRCNSAFRESLLRSDEILKARAQWSLVCDLEEGGGARSVAVSQAAILALQLALVDMLEPLGLRPSAVIGHSLGEAAAACVAGALSREDAIQMLLLRGELSQRIAGQGKMAAIGLPEEDAQAIVDRHAGLISIAAINSDRSVVLSGDSDAIDRVREEARRGGFTFAPLVTDCAFHSPQVMPLVPRLVQAARSVKHRTPGGVMYSTVTGRRIEGAEFGPVYWGRNLAEPVRFAEAVSTAIRDGYRDFLEIGPSAVLNPHVRRLLDTNCATGCVVSLIRGEAGEWESVLRALGDHYEHGHDLRWESLYPTARPVVPLPVYPWQRQRYWLEDEIPETPRIQEIQPAGWAWHDVAGERVLSAAGFLDAVIDALGEAGRGTVQFERVEIQGRLASRDSRNVAIRPSLMSRPDGACEFTIGSLQSERHASGIVRLLSGAGDNPAASLPLSITRVAVPLQKAGCGAAALLDTCLRMAASSYVERQGPAFVAAIDLVVLRPNAREPLYLRSVIHHAAEHGCTLDIDAVDADERSVVHLRGLRLQRPMVPPGIQHWTYEIAWQPSEISPVAAVSEAPSIYEKAAPQIEAFCAELAAEALRKRPAHIQDRYRALLARLVEIGGRATGLDGAIGTIRSQLRREFPELDPEMDLLARCAEALPAVLDGRADPLEVIFTPGVTGLGPADRVYRESPFARHWNDVVKTCVLEALDGAVSSSPVRILEVGAGTGGTTAALLPPLSGRNVEYWFTDIGGWFLSRARTEFANYPFVRYARLDFMRDPASQHFDAKNFDIVIAANCIHAAPDVFASLQTLKSLVRPGGLFVLLEGTGNREWADLTFGATEGWFHDGAPKSPMDADQWVNLLVEAGWEGAHPVAQNCGTVVLAARSSSPEKRYWVLLGNPLGNALGVSGKIAAALRASGEDIRLADSPSVVASAEGEPEGVLDCRYAEPFPACGQSVRMAVELAQALAARNWRRPPQLWLVTCGSHTPQTPAQLPASAVNGVARVLFTEHPEFAGGTIDLDNVENLDVAAAQIRRIMGHRAGEQSWSLRGGNVYVARLKRRSAECRMVPMRDQGTYLITGGTGGMGLHQAAWLARRGARHIVLAGRRQRPELAHRIAEIEALGAQISVRAADVADRGQLARVIEEIAASQFPLRGVIHSAGVAHDAVIANLTVDVINRVLRPKVAGAWNLHALTQDVPLDFFLLCSSAATVIGLTGLCAYTAANAYLDGLAAYRRALGLPAHAIDWGGWRGTGMAERVGGGREHQSMARGLYTMDPERAVEALALAIGAAGSRTCVMSVDWEEFRNGFPAGRIPALYEPLLPKPTVAAQPVAVVPSATILLERLQHAAISERPDLFFAFLRDRLSKLLADNLPARLDPGQSILELGLDSLMAVEMRNSLAGALGINLPVTSLFDYPTPEALLCHAARLAGLELPAALQSQAAAV